jgi:hypothetical protein
MLHIEEDEEQQQLQKIDWVSITKTNSLIKFKEISAAILINI